jgi:hypothetical protein
MDKDQNRVKPLAVAICFTLLASFHATANDNQSLTQKADDAKVLSLQLEQTQLDKARQAAKDSSDREQDVLKRQQSRDWEKEQREKAQQEFNTRESREQKYLREAKEAAAKERKIPKP